MMKCSYCGAKYPNAMPFCPVCGLLSPPRGQKMIRVVGIFFTAGGGFSLLVNMLEFVQRIVRTEDVAYFVFLLFWNMVQLGAGIAGIVFARQRAKGSLMILFGVVLIALGAINGIWQSTVTNSSAMGAFFMSTAGFTLPVLSIIGGSMRRSSPY